jgi:hypothetical protein
VNRPAYIYGFIDPRTGQVRYVGKTWNLEKRLHEHFSRAGDAVVNLPLYRWFRFLLSIGAKPGVRVLEMVSPYMNWESYERKWIAELKPDLNCTPGGDGGPTLLGRKMGPRSQETKDKIARTREERGRNVMSSETASKISLGLKGRIFSPEHRSKLSESGLDRFVSEKAKAAVSQANKDRVYTPEMREARRQRVLGRNNPNWRGGGMRSDT